MLTERLVASARYLAQLLEVITDADQLSRGDVVLERWVVELRPLTEEVVARVPACCLPSGEHGRAVALWGRGRPTNED